jgi:hypothetical protein
MVTIPGEDFGTRNMEPLPDASNPHPGLINVEYLRSCQKFSNPFFNLCKVLVTILHGIYQCPCAYGTSKNVRECLSDPVIGKELVDAEVNHERFEVTAILDGILYI